MFALENLTIYAGLVLVFVTSFRITTFIMAYCSASENKTLDDTFLEEVTYNLEEAKAFCLKHSKRTGRRLNVYKKGFLFPRYKVGELCPWGYDLFLEPNL